MTGEQNVPFWKTNTDPRDRELCLIRYHGRVHPEFCIWWEEKKRFSLPGRMTECEADNFKRVEIDAWASILDLPGL